MTRKSQLFNPFRTENRAGPLNCCENNLFYHQSSISAINEQIEYKIKTRRVKFSFNETGTAALRHHFMSSISYEIYDVL